MNIQFDFDEVKLDVPGGKTWVCFKGTAFANRYGRITGIRFDGSDAINLADSIPDGFARQLYVWLSSALEDQYEEIIRELLDDLYWDRAATHADRVNESV